MTEGNWVGRVHVDHLIAINNASPREGLAMRRIRLFGLLALVCLLAVQLAACAGGTTISSKRLCEGAGGTYAGGACNPGKAMKAEEMCQFHGGVYNPSTDTCALGSDKSR
jgi:hypothetical protein